MKTYASIPISELTLDPANARMHPEKNMEAIKGSLLKFGQQRPILVNRSHVVIAGNGTLKAAKALGWDKIDVRYTDLTGPEAIAYALADNRSSELAEWDKDILGAQLQSLYEDGFGIAEIGFDPGDWLKDIVPKTPFDSEREDEIPENVPTRVKPGDIWQLGDHRLMCGDSTDETQVQALMLGEKADMIFTDPPYNHASDESLVSQSVSQAMKKLANSEWDKNFSFESTAKVIEKFMAPNCTVYVCTSWHLAGAIWAWMARHSNYSGYCVWHKTNPMPSLMKRHWTWSTELICYATYGKHVFNFPDEGHASNVWQIKKNAKNDLHPTQKPVEVPAHAISHSSKPRAKVLDLFLGSGTTLIACEKLGRVCRGMEIDPKYCDIILARWENLTGKKAELTST